MQADKSSQTVPMNVKRTTELPLNHCNVCYIYIVLAHFAVFQCICEHVDHTGERVGAGWGSDSEAPGGSSLLQLQVRYAPLCRDLKRHSRRTASYPAENHVVMSKKKKKGKREWKRKGGVAEFAEENCTNTHGTVVIPALM